MKSHDYTSAADFTEYQAKLYLDYLEMIYCAYNHLTERFSELASDERFEDLSGMIDEIIKKSENQLEKLDAIYLLIGQRPNVSKCAGFIQFLEENFDPIQHSATAKALRRPFLLSYLQYSNSILLTSFGLIQLGAGTVFSTQVCQLINGLLLLAKKKTQFCTQ